MSAADVCMILEGTYPFVHGGVSAWLHDLIRNQKQLTFSLICIVPLNFDERPCFTLPDNVVGMQVVPLTKIRRKRKKLRLTARRLRIFFSEIKSPMLKLIKQQATPEDFQSIVSSFSRHGDYLNYHDLMQSGRSWQLLLEMYDDSMPELSFLDFFWSWRTLVGGFFSMMMVDIPEARCYHSICTGYAGILLSRIKHQTGAACVLTEHGIYTIERRFEIAFAEWLVDQKSFSMSVNKSRMNYELRDLWTDFFIEYGRFCYQSSDRIISLFQDNLKIQVAGGAPEGRCRVIPNGIDLQRYGKVIPAAGHPPAVAFIGRIVPIKDVKTYIRAIAILARNIPDLVAFIIGGHDEDQEYYEECMELVESEALGNTIRVTGKADIVNYLPEIDVVVLSSISEAQPLVILEAGAAGIPSVATNGGACREMIEGSGRDQLGPGGLVVPLASPGAMADALSRLLLDEQFYARCSEAIRKRVATYYSSQDQHRSYRELYHEMLNLNNVDREA